MYKTYRAISHTESCPNAATICAEANKPMRSRNKSDIYLPARLPLALSRSFANQQQLYWCFTSRFHLLFVSSPHQRVQADHPHLQGLQVWLQSGSDWTQMGQIRGFFRSDFSAFGAGRWVEGYLSSKINNLEFETLSIFE